MQWIKNHKPLITVLCCVFVAAIFFLASAGTVWAVNVKVRDAEVKVFVGESLLQGIKVDQYARQKPDFAVEAVINLDDYYEDEDVLDFVTENGLTLRAIYLWEPGETGRMRLKIEDNDFEAAYERHEEFVTSRPRGEARMEAFAKFQAGEFKIFAITVSGTLQDLAEVAPAQSIASRIDPKYYPDVEKYAARKGLSVKYIELPQKPDGAL